MRERPKRQRACQLDLIALPGTHLRVFETHLESQGSVCIAGVDEAGRGSLAGPVVAAAVILPSCLDIPGINDSKKLTKVQREDFYELISQKSVSWALGVVGPEEIDRVNILEASLVAMREAVSNLKIKPDHLLIDGPFVINSPIKQKAIKKGDGLSVSIAAASIMAKVSRDRMMCELEEKFPSFRFSIHKGYGTEMHLSELSLHGPTPVHRKTFRGVVKGG